jgi:hypothetical protein
MVNRNSTFIQFWKIFPTARLIGTPRLFDFGHIFSYLHVIRTPRLLESSEYVICESSLTGTFKRSFGHNSQHLKDI